MWLTGMAKVPCQKHPRHLNDDNAIMSGKNKEANTDQPIQKILRKDIEKMSTMEFMRSALTPYRRLFSYLKPYRGRFALGILFGALFGMLNGMLIITIQLVAAIIWPQNPEALSSMMAQLPEQFQGIIKLSGNEPTLITILFAVSAVPLVMALRGLFGYLNSYCMIWVGIRVLGDIRTELFGDIMNQSLSFFGREKSGNLIQTVFNQTRMAQSALTTVASDVIKQPVSIISAIAALLFIDAKFTMVALVLFPACIVPVIIIGKKVRSSGGKEEEEAGMLMVVMQEAFAGIRVVKSHAREDYENERFIRANNAMLAFMMRWRKAMEIVGPIVETVASVGVAMALLYAWMNDLGTGTFLGLSAGLSLLYPPFKTLSRLHVLMQKCLAATTKVFEMMDQKSDINDAPDARSLQLTEGRIELSDVTFGYVNGTNAVEQVSLTVLPGKTYALVGQSGAGKSTIMSLLMRFYDPDQGDICIDGQNLRQLKQQSLRDHIGIVNQDIFLFHDTIYSNILYGKLDATREEVELAAQQAYAHEFILEQPLGYDTIIGDKGCLLSGGQQQRLSIARAILRNAPILLLDEATSALDSESEQKIQQAIENLAQGKTVIAIAHRLSTILSADQIVVMDSGQVVATGTHTELLETSPQYKRLYDLQFGEGKKAQAQVEEDDAVKPPNVVEIESSVEDFIS